MFTDKKRFIQNLRIIELFFPGEMVMVMVMVILKMNHVTPVT